MVPPHNQNMVGVCNEITLLILYCISSRVEVIDSLIFFYVIVSFKLILAFRYFFPELSISLMPYIV